MNKQQANKILVVVGWICFLGSVIAWPVSAVTWARDEPQTILGLSWAAVIMTGATILLQAETKRDVDEGN